MSSLIFPSFSKDIPNKIGKNIQVSGKNTLIKTVDNWNWRFAIADKAIDAKVDGKKTFCARVENSGEYSDIMFGVRVENAGKQSWMMHFGFTPMETFDSTKEACFGDDGFTGCGIYLRGGNLFYPVYKYHNIIDREISEKATEVISILTISNKRRFPKEHCNRSSGNPLSPSQCTYQ
jgi:hypothetical protein